MMRKYINKVFIYLIFFFITYVYLVNVKIVWIDLFPISISQICYLISFTCCSFMLLWSLVKTMMTDPGKVPQNWGFFLDQNEQRKRRFCLNCHLFKPERCHHCSACNRCVLNMDHHCPWINNCVGFYNRKFFMQMLFYVILDSFMGLFGLFIGLRQEYINIQNDDFQLIKTLLILIAFGVCGLAIFLITRFFKMHIDLVLENRTTIENLERKRSEEQGQNQEDKNPYDLGHYYNWVQVFGTNKYYWFLPIDNIEGRPSGDGILWPRRHRQDSEQTGDNFPSTNNNTRVQN
ncbi:hypothetical protein pb186bvf_000135 [Paramecium bursaria]